jgi:hypothetical protein
VKQQAGARSGAPRVIVEFPWWTAKFREKPDFGPSRVLMRAYKPLLSHEEIGQIP